MRVTTSLTASHSLAINDLFAAMQVDTQLQAGVDIALQSLLQPGMEPYAAVIRKFLAGTMSLDALRGPLTDMYASRFTESEVKDLTAFYTSPLGSRLAAEGPSLTAECAMLGQRSCAERMPELIAALEQEQSKQLMA